MAGVFKAGRGYYYPVQPTTDTVVIDNSIKAKPAAPQIPQDTADPVVNAGNTESTDEISVRHRQELEQEKDKITSYYRAEGEKALAEARERAQKILSDTEQQAQDYAAKAKAQAEAIFEKSKADGFAKGHEDGYAAGCDDGANDTPRATYDETNNFVGRKERQDYVRGYREGYAVGLEDGVSEQQFGI